MMVAYAAVRHCRHSVPLTPPTAGVLPRGSGPASTCPIPPRAERTRAHLQRGRTAHSESDVDIPFGPLRPERGPRPRNSGVRAGRAACQVRLRPVVVLELELTSSTRIPDHSPHAQRQIHRAPGHVEPHAQGGLARSAPARSPVGFSSWRCQSLSGRSPSHQSDATEGDRPKEVTITSSGCPLSRDGQVPGLGRARRVDVSVVRSVPRESRTHRVQ